jgi:hypothetical protein
MVELTVYKSAITDIEIVELTVYVQERNNRYRNFYNIICR